MEDGMKRWGWLVGVAVLMSVSVCSFGQEKQETTKVPPHVIVGKEADAGPIKDMAWFVGKWRAVAKPPNGDPPVTVDSDMRWSENHRVITFQVWFTSKGKREAHYFGMYAWDPEEKTLKMWQVAVDGNLSTGKAKTDGKTFTQDTHMVRADGSTQEQHSVIVRDGNDAFDWKVQLQKDGQWVDALKLRYERVKTASKTGGMQ
jgi:hypothetical protein